jgi:undecaprenyl-diphosphatase
MMQTLQAWDEALLLALNGSPEWMHVVAWFLTSKWATLPIAFLLLRHLFSKHTRYRSWIGFGMLVLTVGGTDAISSRLMKPGFERLRPSHAPELSGQLSLHKDHNGTPYRGGNFGMVSSHAANTFGLATMAILLFGGGKWRWLWVWAGIVSWTRIYLGVHYPGDILMGALFGSGWACAVYTTFIRIQRPRHPQ